MLFQMDWSKVWIFFADERNVKHSSSDSTVGAYSELFKKVKQDLQLKLELRINIIKQFYKIIYAELVDNMAIDICRIRNYYSNSVNRDLNK